MSKESVEILGLILARGGSKGIPRKNIKELAGKPLIAYSIEAANNSQYIDRLVLSTDDEKIAQVGKDYGAEVPFLRPEELATDEAKSSDAILHSLNWLEDNGNYKPDYIMLLQPTSPLRTTQDIDEAVEKLIQNDEKSVISVCEVDESPYWMKTITNKGYLSPFIESDYKDNRRQNLPEVYIPNGAIYLVGTDIFLRAKGFYSSKTVAYIMPKERSVDIDDMLDWKLAELLLEEKKND